MSQFKAIASIVVRNSSFNSYPLGGKLNSLLKHSVFGFSPHEYFGRNRLENAQLENRKRSGVLYLLDS